MRSALILWLAAGCVSGSGSSGPHFSGGGGGGVDLFERPDRRCTVRPNTFTSWRAPFELAPTCVSEGWVRQVVRDIGEIDDCDVGSDELELGLWIDKRGHVVDAAVALGPAADVRECIADTMRRWEFAPGATTGYLRILYRLHAAAADVRDRVLVDWRVAAVSEEREANRPDVARVDRGLPL